MRKLVLIVALPLLSFNAHAETVRLTLADSVQEGIRFKNLGKCLFVQSEANAAIRDVEIDLKPDDFGNAQGQWKKDIMVGFKKVQYRVTAKRSANAGQELSLNAQILVNGNVENATALKLDGEYDEEVTPINGLDAVVAYDDTYCYSANLEVRQPLQHDMQLSLSEAARK